MKLWIFVLGLLILTPMASADIMICSDDKGNVIRYETSVDPAKVEDKMNCSFIGIPPYSIDDYNNILETLKNNPINILKWEDGGFQFKTDQEVSSELEILNKASKQSQIDAIDTGNIQTLDLIQAISDLTGLTKDQILAKIKENKGLI